MKNLIIKDRKNRVKNKNLELKTLYFKTELRNKKLTLKQKDKIIFTNLKSSNQAKKIRVRNRCIVTGRGRGVYSAFKISRIPLRKMLSEGGITGFRKNN